MKVNNPENQIERGFYTKNEVSQLYGISERTVDSNWRKGRIPSPIESRKRNVSRNRRLWNKEEIQLDLEAKGILSVSQPSQDLKEIKNMLVEISMNLPPQDGAAK